MAEQVFLDEFARSVGQLSEQISGIEADGMPRALRDAAVADLDAVIGRYRRFDLRSDARLDEMISLVQRTMEGVTPRRLRDQPGLRRTVATRLSWVQASLAAMAGEPAR
jgi:hypothetical protein